MIFMWFLFFLFATIGLSHIIVHGSILQPVKQWLSDNKYNKILEMSNCYQCSGFWAGLFVSLIMFILGQGWFYLLGSVLYGWVGSFASDATGTILDWIKMLPAVKLEDTDEK